MTRKHDKTGRSKGESRHVRLYHWVMKTEAWQSLSATSRAIYIEIAARYNGSNNGRIPYSLRESAASLKIGTSTVRRALDELIDRGFIIAAAKGAFSLKVRHATEWLMTEHPSNLGNGLPELPSRDFARWTKKQNTVPVAALSVPVAAPIGTHNGTVTKRRAA